MHEKDYATNNFLQWFVTEQVEEEANVDEIIQKLEMIGDNKSGLYMLDNELDQELFHWLLNRTIIKIKTKNPLNVREDFFYKKIKEKIMNKIIIIRIPNISIFKFPPSSIYSLGYFPPEKNFRKKYPTL